MSSIFERRCYQMRQGKCKYVALFQVIHNSRSGRNKIHVHRDTFYVFVFTSNLFLLYILDHTLLNLAKHRYFPSAFILKVEKGIKFNYAIGINKNTTPRKVTMQRRKIHQSGTNSTRLRKKLIESTLKKCLKHSKFTN